jgi:hypothetical protein
MPGLPLLARPGWLKARHALPLALIGLAGCQGTAEQGRSFSVEEHRPFLARGNSAIEGEGFIRRPNGFLARCSGLEVQLAPQSDYFKEWVGHLRAGKAIAERAKLASMHRSALRTTQCDATGRFVFADLPAGRWYVSTRMGYADDRDSFAEDGLFLADVETRPGEVARIVLSNPNRIQ